MNINTFRLPLHSFVDLITNSSTEIYVSAHDKTISAAKAMVNKVLAAAGSDKIADDLFDFKLTVSSVDEETWEDVEYDAKSPEGKKVLKEDEQPQLNLVVTAKVDSPDAKEAAKALSKLTDLFVAEKKYE